MVAVWLFVLVIGGYAGWLSEVIPSIVRGDTQVSVHVMALPVSIVHVLDMAFMLPLIMIGAINLWQGNSSRLVVSAATLVFVLLIGISVIFMEIALDHAGFDMDIGKLIFFCFTVPINLFMTIFMYRKLTDMMSIH